MDNKKKFLFDVHVFGSDGEDLAADNSESDLASPPPAPEPTYTQTQYEQAEKKAYDKGKVEAMAEIQAAAEQSTTTLLKQIKASLDMLVIEDEKRREAFDVNVISLMRSILQKTFPMFVSRYSSDVIEEKLAQSLQGHNRKDAVAVYVASDLKPVIEKTLKDGGIDNATIHVDDQIDAMQVRVEWSDGGIVIDHDQVLNKIENILTDLLEENGESSHDRKEEESKAVPAEDAEAQPEDKEQNQDT